MANDYVNKNFSLVNFDIIVFQKIIDNFTSLKINEENYTININGWIITPEVLRDVYEIQKSITQSIEKFVNFIDLDRLIERVENHKQIVEFENNQKKKQSDSVPEMTKKNIEQNLDLDDEEED